MTSYKGDFSSTKDNATDPHSMLPMNDRIHKGVIDNYIITALLG